MAAYEPTHDAHTILRSSDGQIFLSGNSPFLAHLSEHFQCLFSADSNVQDTTIHHIPQLLKHELDEPSTFQEAIEAIIHFQCLKAASVVGIPPEILKFGGPILHVEFYDLLVCCWKQGKLPQDFCGTIIISLYKNKGETSDCSNYQGITLLSIACDVLARGLLNRLIPTISEESLPRASVASEPTDMVFVLLQLQEKCKEQNLEFYASFVDLTNGFDLVSRTGLWLVLK